jgi:uncharacterized membrane protein
MFTCLRAAWEYLRGTYWAVPSAMAVAAVGLSVVLSTLAASMITVAGVTFSITIVALTLASQQFDPRLLRNFRRTLKRPCQGRLRPDSG